MYLVTILSQKVGMSAHGTISITEYTQCEDVVVLVLNEFTRNNYCSFSLQKVKIRHYSSELISFH